MRRMLQQRFLGCVVLLLLFVAVMTVLFLTVQQKPADYLLAPVTQGVSTYTHGALDDALRTSEPLDELAVVAMMADEAGAPRAPLLDEPETTRSSSMLAESTHGAKDQVSTESTWVLQVGSFVSQNNAERLRAALHKSGWSAFMRPDRSVPSQLHYRVYAGPFASLSEIKDAKNKIDKRFQSLGLVMKGSV